MFFRNGTKIWALVPALTFALLASQSKCEAQCKKGPGNQQTSSQQRNAVAQQQLQQNSNLFTQQQQQRNAFFAALQQQKQMNDLLIALGKRQSASQTQQYQSALQLAQQQTQAFLAMLGQQNVPAQNPYLGTLQQQANLLNSLNLTFGQ